MNTEHITFQSVVDWWPVFSVSVCPFFWFCDEESLPRDLFHVCVFHKPFTKGHFIVIEVVFTNECQTECSPTSS